MYARRVTLNLKPNCKAEFTQKLQSDIIPMLRKQKGFLDEISFVTSSGKEAFGISLWDNKQSADDYSHGSYTEVTKALSKMVDGTPTVETYDVSNSTFHKIGVAAIAGTA